MAHPDTDGILPPHRGSSTLKPAIRRQGLRRDTIHHALLVTLLPCTNIDCSTVHGGRSLFATDGKRVGCQYSIRIWESLTPTLFVIGKGSPAVCGQALEDAFL